MNPFVADEVPQRAHVLVTLGVICGAAFSALIVLFIGGEILADPGGLVGLGLVLAWLAVPALLCALALVRPQAAYPALVVMVALVLIAALIPLVALGRSMPARAGWPMIITTAGSVAFLSVSLLLVGQWSFIFVFAVLMAPYAAVAIDKVATDVYTALSRATKKASKAIDKGDVSDAIADLEKGLDKAVNVAGE